MNHPTETDLRALLANRLPEDRAESVAIHLDGCPGCRNVADRLTEVPRDLWAALVVAADRPCDPGRPAAPSVPGYVGLQELGRGGCGVVYRATEAVTGREVALKLLRAGALASPAEHEWFLAEARAAAGLRHPNIVTVLAVGEAYELPYYAMEYLPAGSLASRLDGTPLPPTEAAALVAAVADAIQHAHEAGVIHRDLKPGNILLDGSPGSARLETPKVSDFGMAKLSEATLAATPSQAVLGTPSYMAPEQAFGRSREVGPSADVYALGAVLYELLTGRPPFKGATPYETLLLVRDEDPVPPRELRPGLPRDLETVCLKSLEKEPGRRYTTAAGLAVDLRAYIAGRPVTARPVGWPGRLVRWSRREPAVASLGTLSLALLVSLLVATTVLWRRAEARGATSREVLRLYTQAASKLFRNPGLVSREERDALVRAIELYERVLDEVSGDPGEERRAAYATLQLADGLNSLGEFDTSARVARRAVHTLRRLSETYPGRPDYRSDYADGCSQLGNLLARIGPAEEATALRREAVRIGEELVGRYPSDDTYRATLEAYRINLALDHARRGDEAHAERLFRTALDANRELVARYSQDPSRYQFFAAASRGLAHLLIGRGEVGPYRGLMAERLALCDRARPQPNWPLIAPHLVDLELAVVLDRAGDRDGASRVMAMGLELGAAQVSQGPPHPASLVNYAAWLDADGHRLWPTDPRLAADRFRRAVSALEQAASSPSGSGAEPALAAVLAFCPDPSVRDPHRAVELAHRGAKGPIRRSYVAGAALYEAGQLTDARAELEAYLDEDRSEGAHGQIARAYLAMAFWRAGETGRAAAELRKAGESFRSDPRTLWQASTAIRRAEMLLSDRRAGSK